MGRHHYRAVFPAALRRLALPLPQPDIAQTKSAPQSGALIALRLQRREDGCGYAYAE
jgi:hypothetical protein